MTTFLLQHFLFLIGLTLYLFVPGYLFLDVLFRKDYFTFTERVVLSVPIGFVLSTFIFLGMMYTGVSLTFFSILTVFLFYVASFCAFRFYQFWKKPDRGRYVSFTLTRTQVMVFALLATIMFCVKGFYLVNTVFPTSTDLGHHMFWSQKMVQTGSVSSYEKMIVSPENADLASTSPAQFEGVSAIPDFIIGEHIVFAVLSLFSGQSVVSAFPSLALFFIHICTILALFLFAYRLFWKTSFGSWAALWTFFFIGPLYAISGAQAKFVSGGVIGNIIGNMLIVSSLYFLYRALIDRKPLSLFVSILLLFGLVYTHHLSTFIVGYVIVFCVFLFCVLNISDLKSHLLAWVRLFLSPSVLGVIVLGGLFAFFVHMPSYLDAETISGSVGSPEKSTRVGIPFWQLATMIGTTRFFFALLGLLVFAVVFAPTKKVRALLGRVSAFDTHALDRYAYSILIGWFSVLFVMTLAPVLLGVNILSTRIATYIAFPSALLAGFFFAWFFYVFLQDKYTKLSCLPLLAGSLFLIMSMTQGLSDSSRSLAKEPNVESAVQTFHNASYIGDHLRGGEWALKDHNYITADTWMKVFMGEESDYSNPLSRGFFARYESKPRREHCTLEMISDPRSDLAIICFDNLSVGPVSVLTEQDAGGFLRNDAFIKVYQNDHITTFWRK